MRRFGKTFVESARRGMLAGLYALIIFMDSFGGKVVGRSLERGWKRFGVGLSPL